MTEESPSIATTEDAVYCKLKDFRFCVMIWWLLVALPREAIVNAKTSWWEEDKNKMTIAVESGFHLHLITNTKYGAEHGQSASLERVCASYL